MSDIEKAAPQRDEDLQSDDKPVESKPASLYSKTESSSNRNVVPHTWDSPADPDNPRNWSFVRRVYGTFVPAWYSLGITLGTAMYTPAVFLVEPKFHVSQTAALVGLTVYAIGISLGPMLGAPISETIGRRWVFLISMPISLLFTMGAGLSKNFGTLLVCRFLASTFGSPSIAIGAGTIADLWDMHKGGSVAGMCFVLMPFMGSALGPLIGGFAVERQGKWEWTMWVMIMIAGPAWIAALFSPETYAKVILKKRAIKRGLPQPPKPPPKQVLRTLLLVALLRPMHMMFFEPIVGWMSLYTAFAFGILFGFFDAFPYVFGGIYNFDLEQIGLTYLGIIVGELLAVVTYVIMYKTVYAKSRANIKQLGKVPPPEERLYISMMGSIALPISLFWFGWTARHDIHWIVPLLAGMPFGWGLILLFVGITNYLLDTYLALNAASAMAANGLLRYTFAGVFPLFTVQMYEKLGVDWSGSLLAFISIGLLPIPWIFYKYGPALRKRSSYETENL